MSETFEFPVKARPKRRVLATQVLWTLRLDGDIEDDHSVAELERRLQLRGVIFDTPTTVSTCVRWLADEVGAIERVTGIKKTTAIRLVTQVLPPNPFNGSPPAAPAEPVLPADPTPFNVCEDGLPESYELPAAPATDGSLSDILLKITALASEALVVGSGGSSTALAAERLAAALERCASLERRLRAAEETAVAHKSRADGLAKMNRQLQANLDAIVKSGGPVDDRAWKELDRMTRERPRPGMRV